MKHNDKHINEDEQLALENKHKKLNERRWSNARILKRFGIILLVLSLMAGGMCAAAFLKRLPADIKDVRGDALEEGEAYYFSELTVLDAYGYMGADTLNPQRKTPYTLVPGEASAKQNLVMDDLQLLIRFMDRTGQTCYAELTLREYSAVKQACEAYVMDPEKAAGGLQLSAGLLGYINQSDVFDVARTTAYEYYSADEPGTLLDWQFFLEFESLEELRWDHQRSGCLWLFISGILLAAALFVLMVYRVQRGRILKSEEKLHHTAEEMAERVEKRWMWARIWSVAFGTLMLLLLVMWIVNMCGVQIPLALVVIVVACLFTSVLVYMAYAVPMKRMHALAEEAAIGRAEIVRDLENAVVCDDMIRCGQEILLVPGPYVLPVSQLKWVYAKENRTAYGLALGYEMVYEMRSGKSYTLLVDYHEECDLILNLLKDVRDTRMPDLLLGDGEDTRSAFAEFKKGLQE